MVLSGQMTVLLFSKMGDLTCHRYQICGTVLEILWLFLQIISILLQNLFMINFSWQFLFNRQRYRVCLLHHFSSKLTSVILYTWTWEKMQKMRGKMGEGKQGYHIRPNCYPGCLFFFCLCISAKAKFSSFWLELCVKELGRLTEFIVTVLVCPSVWEKWEGCLLGQGWWIGWIW